MTETPVKETKQIGKGAPGPGRPKGLPNKTTALLKDAILKAATQAGDGDIVAYLAKQAIENPAPFMSLLGKVMPLQLTGEDGASIMIQAITGVPRADRPD